MDLSSLFSLFAPPDGLTCTFTASYLWVIKNTEIGIVSADTVIPYGAGNLKPKQISATLGG